MKTILCYGDSLTWGYDPEGPGRHVLEDRWPSVLQAALGDRAHVIAEGLNGRTTVFDDFAGPADRNGARVLPTLLASHAPLDLMILMLGSNDMKPWIAGRAIVAAKGVRRLVEIVRTHPWSLGAGSPDILIVAPPPMVETADPDFGAVFEGGIEQSHMLASLYADLADEMGCGFYDAGSAAQASPLDGVHLDAKNTRAIGKGLEPVTRMMLGL